jgi:hypothetical protein
VNIDDFSKIVANAMESEGRMLMCVGHLVCVCASVDLNHCDHNNIRTSRCARRAECFASCAGVSVTIDVENCANAVESDGRMLMCVGHLVCVCASVDLNHCDHNNKRTSRCARRAECFASCAGVRVTIDEFSKIVPMPSRVTAGCLCVLVILYASAQA